jgi:hypothetical protein
MNLASTTQAAARAVQGTPAPKAHKSAQRRPAHVAVPSAQEAIHIWHFEDFMFRHFGKDSSVIPAGIFLTTIVLGSGLASMSRGNQANQQSFMRLRIGTQGVTVLAMLTSLAVQERQKVLGIIES